MNSKNQKGISSLKIEVKKKKFNIKFHNVIWVTFIVIISFFSGMIGVEYIIGKLDFGVQVEQEEIPLNKNIHSDNINNNIIDKVSKSLVTISSSEDGNTENNISGVIISKEGYVITNYSVISQYKDIYVNDYNKRVAKSIIIGLNEELDLALLKVDLDNLYPINIYEDDVSVGTNILALGNINKKDKATMITTGIITSFSDTINNENIIQVNAVINSNNTGGIICNTNGELLGIGSKKISDEKNEQGLYYSIGVKSIKNLMNSLVNDVNILGIDGRTVEEEGEVSFKGLYIQDIFDNSIAKKSGIQITDIIISIDNRKVESMVDIYDVLNDKNPGDVVECTIIRNLEQKVIELTMGKN